MKETVISSNKLHRSVKILLDSGEASSIEEAQKILSQYRLNIFVEDGIMDSPAYQAALLTAVNTGRRCFLGGVQVLGNTAIPLQIPWKSCVTLEEAVKDLQGLVVSTLDNSFPTLSFSTAPSSTEVNPFYMRPIIRGWNGGVVPADESKKILPNESFTPAGVLAGALAVSEAFQFIRGDNPYAGHRTIGLSLWNPKNDESWIDADPGPALKSLPSKLWLIGLGHLGQAYLWTLGFLPYPKETGINLVLQDKDKLEEANDSTSVLTDMSLLDTKKTRAMAAWCEERGFGVNIVDRKFLGDFKIHSNEPAFALCGVDNIEARRDLEKVGFQRIIDAGLGKGPQNYLSMIIHTFPSTKSAEQYWALEPGAEERDDSVSLIMKQKAYQELLRNGADHCGLTELAGHSVGASFVGVIASTLVISLVLRLCRGETIPEIIDGDLRSSPFLRHIIPNQGPGGLFNPGLIHI